MSVSDSQEPQAGDSVKTWAGLDEYEPGPSELKLSQ